MWKSLGHFFASVGKGILRVAGLLAANSGEISQLAQIATGIAKELDPSFAPQVVDGGLALLGEFASVYKEIKASVDQTGTGTLVITADVLKIVEQALPAFGSLVQGLEASPAAKAATGPVQG